MNKLFRVSLLATKIQQKSLSQKIESNRNIFEIYTAQSCAAVSEMFYETIFK